MIRFTQPLALLLLLLLPFVAWIGWPVRGASRRRETVSLIIRLLISLLLILSLAGTEITRSFASNRLAVIFLLDVSDSMSPAAQKLALDYIHRALETMGPDDRAGLIVFGKDALVEHPVSELHGFPPITSIPNTTQTDMAEAIHLAQALFPADAAKRLVILSDGNVTSGDPVSAARLAAASGVEIVVLPFTIDREDEVLVTRLEAPGHMRQGDQFSLEVSIQSISSTKVKIRVFANGSLVAEDSVELHSGEQTFNIPLTAQETGFITFQAQVIPEADTYLQNNQLSAYGMVSGPPRVLVVSPPAGELLGYDGETRPDEVSALRAALEAGGFIVDAIPPSRLPTELALLVNYASVVLVDTPAREINPRQMDALTAFVRDLGGGLVTVGGPTSYGVGGYYRTQLEEALPLEMAIKDEKRRPSLAIVFVIDHSGSMSDTSGGVSKIELAKEAAIRSIELLFPTDRVGVVIFDDSASWVSPLSELNDPSQVIYAVSTIRSGGGTDILAGLQAVAAELPGDPATVKHIILLTDGGADPSGIPELIQNLNSQYGITLSTVGVGLDAAPFLPDLARLGGGRYHFAGDPAAIPSIFTEETTLATRSYIIEEPFIPQLLSDSPILNGIDSLPALYGYVGTSSKSRAQTILVTHKGDPLLAAWQYGLGKVVSFTSDATGRWASDWLGWEGFPTFWIQAVQFTLGEPNPSFLETSIEAHGEQALLTVNAFNPFYDGTTSSSPYLSEYDMKVNIIDAAGSAQELNLVQTASGQYQAEFTPQTTGVYLMRISGVPAANLPTGLPAIAETAGWVLSYSPEYQNLTSNPDLLVRLANSSNGKIASQDPARVFDHSIPAPNLFFPLWNVLLTLAMFLLPVDIASRRLILARSDFIRIGQRITRWVRTSPKPQASLPSERRQQMEALLQIKQQTSPEPAPERDSPPKVIIPPAPDQSPSEAVRPSSIPEQQPSTGKPGTQETQSTASALLARKRERHKDQS